jgi:hypothetical protein
LRGSFKGGLKKVERKFERRLRGSFRGGLKKVERKFERRFKES